MALRTMQQNEDQSHLQPLRPLAAMGKEVPVRKILQRGVGVAVGLAFVLTLLAIWTDGENSDRLANTGALFWIVGIMGGAGLFFIYLDNDIG